LYINEENEGKNEWRPYKSKVKRKSVRYAVRKAPMVAVTARTKV
jgi:hypothetical protein